MEIETALEMTMTRERRKRWLYASFCLVVSGGTVLSMIFGRVYPKSAYWVSGIPAVAFFAVGVYHVVSASRGRIEPMRDRQFLANVLWTTAICAFPALVVVGIDVNGQANGSADAILHGLVGLALLAVAGVYKVLVAVSEAELRLRERLLSLASLGDRDF